MAEEGLQERTHVFTRTYKRKDGTIGYSNFTQTGAIECKPVGLIFILVNVVRF